MSVGIKCLFAETWDFEELERQYPPLLEDGNKQLLYRLAGEPGRSGAWDVGVSRWILDATPSAELSGQCQVQSVSDFFSYLPTQSGQLSDWYLNFADQHLFGFYESALFAQDEMQVAEHPVLASIRERLAVNSKVNPDYYPVTRDKSGTATPYLFTGVERRIAVDTTPDVIKGRPEGLYGNRFRHATEEQVVSVTTVLEVPTLSNILAMDAPRPDSGSYTKKQISQALMTALTGFAAVRTSVDSDNSDHSIIIHSGNWGCGAFGGNRELMYLVQMLAADMAGIEQLQLHAVSEDQFEAASNEYRQMLSVQLDFNGCIECLFEKQYRWGVSDGN